MVITRANLPHRTPCRMSLNLSRITFSLVQHIHLFRISNKHLHGHDYQGAESAHRSCVLKKVVERSPSSRSQACLLHPQTTQVFGRQHMLMSRRITIKQRRVVGVAYRRGREKKEWLESGGRVNAAFRWLSGPQPPDIFPPASFARPVHCWTFQGKGLVSVMLREWLAKCFSKNDQWAQCQTGVVQTMSKGLSSLTGLAIYDVLRNGTQTYQLQGCLHNVWMSGTDSQLTRFEWNCFWSTWVAPVSFSQYLFGISLNCIIQPHSHLSNAGRRTSRIIVSMLIIWLFDNTIFIWLCADS